MPREVSLNSISRTSVVAFVGLVLTTPAVSAQVVVPDSLLLLAASAAPKCKIAEVRRLAGDTAYVAVIDSLLTAESQYEGEWRLCNGVARNQTTRDVAHAILRPLWAAWGKEARVKMAILDIRAINPEEANVRMVLRDPEAPTPKTSGSR